MNWTDVLIGIVIAGIPTGIVIYKLITTNGKLTKENLSTKRALDDQKLKKSAPVVSKDDLVGIEIPLNEPVKHLLNLKNILDLKKDLQKKSEERLYFKAIPAPYDEKLVKVLSLLAIPLFRDYMSEKEAKLNPKDLPEILGSNLEELPRESPELHFLLHDEKWVSIVKKVFALYAAEKAQTYAGVEEVFNYVNGKVYFETVGAIEIAKRSIEAGTEQPDWVKTLLDISDSISVKEATDRAVIIMTPTKDDIPALYEGLIYLKEIFYRPLLTQKAKAEALEILWRQMNICEDLCEKNIKDKVAFKTLDKVRTMMEEMPTIEDNSKVITLTDKDKSRSADSEQRTAGNAR
jgi:hypothetical protein